MSGGSTISTAAKLSGHRSLVSFHFNVAPQLLTAQVVLTDRVDKLAQTLDVAIRELKDAQKHTDERLNALITVADGIVRNRPQQ
jgi:hypothetical protein